MNAQEWQDYLHNYLMFNYDGVGLASAAIISHDRAVLAKSADLSMVIYSAKHAFSVLLIVNENYDNWIERHFAFVGIKVLWKEVYIGVLYYFIR